MGKLRIFGETFVEEKQEDKGELHNKTLIPIKQKQIKSTNKSFTMINQEKHLEKKQKFRTKSLMMKVNKSSQLKISQMYKFNNIQFQSEQTIKPSWWIEECRGGRCDGGDGYMSFSAYNCLIEI